MFQRLIELISIKKSQQVIAWFVGIALAGHTKRYQFVSSLRNRKCGSRTSRSAILLPTTQQTSDASVPSNKVWKYGVTRAHEVGIANPEASRWTFPDYFSRSCSQKDF